MKPRPIVAVHGFMYEKEEPDAVELYRRWADIFERPVEGFFWDSNPGFFKWLWPERAYKKAWRVADQQARLLADFLHDVIEKHGVQPDIVCHSLGSRVVFKAAKWVYASRPRNVLIFSGSDWSASAAYAAVDCWPDTRWLNVIAERDCILKDLAQRIIGIGTSPKRSEQKPGTWRYELTPLVGIEGLAGIRHDRWEDVRLPDADHNDAFTSHPTTRWRQFLSS